ncbi:MAG TPA: formate dehydrogenase-N subunit alpha [Candidatus Baltobacteraceae bacterium]
MPGLGTSFGRGGATSYVQDLQHADCILIEGSNFAEAHPVAFRFVMKAKERGATIVHVDPRFTRTSALADVYVALRSGSDIAFLGGIVNWVLQNERYFREYVVAYTNASYLVREDFRDTEDLAGLFSGFDESAKAYDRETWDFERAGDGGIARDETLAHPRCVINVLRKHFSRYTPEMVERVCGVSPAQFAQVCETLARNSGRDRTTAFAYAVGWTQHTVGVQYIRTAAILQLLLGNIGRPGGGIMALRGHANIQGATDIATLYDLLPGYLAMPSTAKDEQTLAAYLRTNARSGWWEHFPAYIVSLLKAFYGGAATPENDYCFDYLPQCTGDHSTLPTQIAMKDGVVKGYFVIGQNPAASGQNGAMINAGFERLEWMVNVDSYETETASFWKREGADPSTIATECFFIPAATILEKSGTMVNTNRLLQWHDQAIEPLGDSVTDAWFIHTLGKRLKELYAGSIDPKDRPLLDMTWDYGSADEPSTLRVLQEINGYDTRTGEQLRSFVDLRDDGSTAAGGWIYTGVCPDAQTNNARARVGDDDAALGWGWAWPANRRMLYNRASAAPDGAPWSERKRYVWWDEAGGAWRGDDVADVVPGARPGHDDQAFLMQTDGRGALFVPEAGLLDGPFPTHYEPSASVVENALYPQQSNPTLRTWRRADNPEPAGVDPQYPHVLTTYRITEMSGIMTRYVPWLAELQPAAFCEIDPQLAVEQGIASGDIVTVSTALGDLECKALVSGRMRPLRIGGKRVHTVGVPYNYGALGLARGDSAGRLIPLVMDPNVSIHESKSLTCAIRRGPRVTA